MCANVAVLGQASWAQRWLVTYRGETEFPSVGPTKTSGSHSLPQERESPTFRFSPRSPPHGRMPYPISAQTT
jgi:hypothetical protein